jgi:hypothetical protein
VTETNTGTNDAENTTIGAAVAASHGRAVRHVVPVRLHHHLLPLAADVADAKVKKKLCDFTLGPFLVVAIEEADLLHTALAIFGAQVPVQVHYL